MSLSKPNDFAEDVLEQLKTRKVTFRGCPPWYIELNGTKAKVWFYGYRNNKPYAGGITIMADINNAIVTGNSKMLAELCEKIVDHSQVRFG